MADMILKTEDKDAVAEMNHFLKSLTEDQRRFMLTTLDGVKLGLELAERRKNEQPVA